MLRIITLVLLGISFSIFANEYRELSLKDYRRMYLKQCFPERSVPKDFLKDKKRSEILKGHSSPESCTILGEIYQGMYDKSENESYLNFAKRSFTQGCKNNELLSCARLGNIYKLEQNNRLAFQFLTKACNGGVEVACRDIKLKKESDLLLWASTILIGIIIFFLTSTIFQEQMEFEVTEQLEEATAKKDMGKHGIILRYSRPFFKRYISPTVGSMKFQKTIKEKYKRPLASAGLTDYLEPEDFFSFKLFLIIGFPITFLVLRTFLEETWPLSYIPLVAVAGYFYPNFWINGKIKNRQKDIILNMPFSVDMLALSVEAGLDFMAAFAKVVERSKKTALTEEFEILMKEIKVGASRAEGLRNMAWRINLMQVTSFSATLIAADSIGASIGPILKNLSAEIRQKKSAEIEKAGAQAATKILIPMMIFILPAVLLAVASPLALEFMTGMK